MTRIKIWISYEWSHLIIGMNRIRFTSILYNSLCMTTFSNVWHSYIHKRAHTDLYLCPSWYILFHFDKFEIQTVRWAFIVTAICLYLIDNHMCSACIIFNRMCVCVCVPGPEPMLASLENIVNRVPAIAVHEWLNAMRVWAALVEIMLSRRFFLIFKAMAGKPHSPTIRRESESERLNKVQ